MASAQYRPPASPKSVLMLDSSNEFSDSEDASHSARAHPCIVWLFTMADVYNDGNLRKTIRALLEYAPAQWDMAVVLTRTTSLASTPATNEHLATFDGVISKNHGDWLSRMAVRYGLASGAEALLRLLAYGAKCEERADDIFGVTWVRTTTLTIMLDVGMYSGLLTAEPLSFRLSPKALYCHVERPRGQGRVNEVIWGIRWTIYTAGEAWVAGRAVLVAGMSWLQEWLANGGSRGFYVDLLFKRADRYTY